MNTKLNPSRRRTASALMVALSVMTILALSIAGYLMFVQQQSFLGARAQAWNMAMSISEAGVEEALQQLNSNSSQLTSDGWTANGTVYSISRDLANGSSYSVYISNSVPNAPVIVSRAHVRPPTLAGNAPTIFYAAGGVNESAKKVSRAVRVTTSRGSLLLGAMVAKHKIDMNGNDVLADSFDSADTAKSTGGRYDPTKVGDRGDVASNDGVVNAVDAGNANLYGHVSTGPGGSVSIGSQGGIGDHAWQAANGNTPEPNWVLHNANFTFTDTSLPYNSGLAASPGDIVSILSTTTNQTVYNNVSSPPGPLGLNENLGPVTTNTNFTTTSSYPGQPGQTTNVTWNTAATYPGAMPGMITNCIGFMSVSNYPGQRLCATTNGAGTTTSLTYPGNVLGLTTNCVGYTTVAAYPGRKQCMSTNCSNTLTSKKNFPAAGTYCGTPYQTGNGQNNNSDWYYYPVSGYTYANVFSYTYPVYNYTYAILFSYTYPTYTYIYPTYTFSYVVYTGIVNYTTNSYDHVLYSGDYYASDLRGTTIVMGTARLVMPSGLSMNGQDQITIDTSGSLKLYSGGNSLTIGGNGVMNKTGFAANLYVYATPSVTSCTFNGNGEFTGILIAPNANTRMNGGGHAYEDFIGALMVNSVTMNGHFKFHYDEALSRIGGTGRFLVTSWNEIP